MTHTVVRGGFGMFLQPRRYEGSSLRLFRQLPFGVTTTISPGDIFVGQKVSDGFPALVPPDFSFANAPYGSMFAVAPNFRPGYAEQFNLTIRTRNRALGPSSSRRPRWAISAATYITPGTRTSQSRRPRRQNTRRPFYAIDPNLAGVSYFASDGLSEYYAGQLTLDKRLGKGLSGLLGYTWSHAIDNVVLEFGGGAAGPQPQDPRNLKAERGNSIIDLRHRLTASYLYELPFGKGKAMMNRGGIANVVLGGWQTNGILTVQTGQPFLARTANIYDQRTGSRPNIIGPVVYPHTLQQWFSPSAYATPAPYTYGNASRNSLFGPGRTNLDASLFKNFVIREQVRFEFRAEAFNVFNHPQFGLPNQNIGNAQVGSITSTVGNPRQLQMGLRFSSNRTAAKEETPSPLFYQR